jgi:predicted Zn-dependent protease with MMP-like domain
MSRPRLTLDEFCQIVGEVLDDLPDEFRQRLENVVVDVEERPSPRILAELGHATEECLMGLYQGESLLEQENGPRFLNRIIIFKRPIEAVSRSREEVAYEIRRTVLHELAHHFGYSEEDLEFFEERPSPFDDEDAAPN